MQKISIVTIKSTKIVSAIVSSKGYACDFIMYINNTMFVISNITIWATGAACKATIHNTIENIYK